MPRDRIVFGSYIWNFVSIQGQPQIPSRVLKTIKMPGVDGKAFKFMSAEAPPARLTLIAPAVDAADQEAWIVAMSELTGRQVTVWDSTGVAYNNQVFHEVVLRGVQTVTVGAFNGISLGSTGRLLTFEATLEYPYGS